MRTQQDLVPEDFLAHWTRHRLILHPVSERMSPKMLRLSKSLGAAATAIWSVVRVHSQVLAEVVFGCETLLAVVAVEGSLTSVSSFMNYFGSGGGEMRIAVLALEHGFGRRVLRVNSHVLLHGRFLEEGFVAERTLVDGPWVLLQFVLLQLVDVGPVGIAVRARQRRFLPCMRAPVEVEVALAREGHRAEIAAVDHFWFADVNADFTRVDQLLMDAQMQPQIRHL